MHGANIRDLQTNCSRNRSQNTETTKARSTHHRRTGTGETIYVTEILTINKNQPLWFKKKRKTFCGCYPFDILIEFNRILGSESLFRIEHAIKRTGRRDLAHNRRPRCGAKQNPVFLAKCRWQFCWPRTGLKVMRRWELTRLISKEKKKGLKKKGSPEAAHKTDVVKNVLHHHRALASSLRCWRWWRLASAGSAERIGCGFICCRGGSALLSCLWFCTCHTHSLGLVAHHVVRSLKKYH